MGLVKIDAIDPADITLSPMAMANDGGTRSRRRCGWRRQDLPRSSAHPFYTRLNQILEKHDFDDCASDSTLTRSGAPALRDFLGLVLPGAPPDHLTISPTRRLIDIETHEAVFTWVLQRLANRWSLIARK